jgi:plasmid stabilization system protein ParE
MRLKILPSALEDLAYGRTFYAKQSESVGAYFFDSLFSDIDSLELFGGIHRKVLGYHRLLSKRFPFVVYYKMDGDEVVVWRVLDCREKPEKTRQALT